MSRMVLVSVIMSSFNHEKYIGESIESVLNQTCKDLELIITDDCSTDRSQKIITDYQKRDARIKATFHQKNLGITKTLNDCLDQATGKFLCFLDSDDLWVEDKIAKQLRLLEKDDSKLVWSQGQIINGQGQPTGQLITEYINAPSKKSGNLFLELLREQFVFRQSLILKTEFVRNLRFDPSLRYVNDHRFMVDLAVDHQFLFIPEPLAKYRLHGNNITTKNESLWAKDKINVRKYFLERYIGKMTPRAAADINYQIGYYLSRLGRKAEAKPYFLKALKIDHSHSNSALYVALALTRGEGLIGNSLVKLFWLAMQFAQNFKVTP